MKALLIVANFKSNKNLSEAKNWLDEFSTVSNERKKIENKKIIVCPPFTLLFFFKSYIEKKGLPIELGAQNISRLPGGAYTGEINGSQIKDFADYVIVGHSERRGSFGEDESVVEEKIKMSIDYNLNPIFCTQSDGEKIPKEVSIVAYEPVFSIGTGNPDTPENAENIAKKIKEESEVSSVLYGGSVTPENVSRFTSMENISGVLVGHASLNPSEFLEIVLNA